MWFFFFLQLTRRTKKIEYGPPRAIQHNIEEKRQDTFDLRKTRKHPADFKKSEKLRFQVQLLPWRSYSLFCHLIYILIVCKSVYFLPRFIERKRNNSHILRLILFILEFLAKIARHFFSRKSGKSFKILSILLLFSKVNFKLRQLRFRKFKIEVNGMESRFRKSDF